MKQPHNLVATTIILFLLTQTPINAGNSYSCPTRNNYSALTQQESSLATVEVNQERMSTFLDTCLNTTDLNLFDQKISDSLLRRITEGGEFLALRCVNLGGRQNISPRAFSLRAYAKVTKV